MSDHTQINCWLAVIGGGIAIGCIAIGNMYADIGDAVLTLVFLSAAWAGLGMLVAAVISACADQWM